MKKLLVIQITAFLLVSGTLGGMFVFTDIYDEVQSSIVSVLCLSCLKLDPKTSLNFTFETANGEEHPAFIIENLSNNLVFLHYSEDVCQACDEMLPIVQDIFGLEFEKEDSVSELVTIENTTIRYIYINRDHATQDLKDTLYIYDQLHIEGLPMFSLITLGYDLDLGGVIKPYYASVYGTLGLGSDEERKTALQDMLSEGIRLYKQNHEGFIEN